MKSLQPDRYHQLALGKTLLYCPDNQGYRHYRYHHNLHRHPKLRLHRYRYHLELALLLDTFIVAEASVV